MPKCASCGSEGRKADSMISSRSLLHATVRRRSFLVGGVEAVFALRIEFVHGRALQCGDSRRLRGERIILIDVKDVTVLAKASRKSGAVVVRRVVR